ncbi:hypothetical protein QR680_013078 [Steinernema hermaphroditum]|uniref:WD repeat-containing protein 19 n=1 Tax=Steinernema hermaphroditum TaxID=289476 RepID=A0AA39M0Z6_9BILA|nr:hypothetical protein QR680_013078 [Steinernema hermaphroditum]
MMDLEIELGKPLGNGAAAVSRRTRSPRDRWPEKATADCGIAALRVFRHMGDVSMVMSLEEVVWIEEKALLSGHLAMITQQFDKAEEYFLLSTEPTLALEMRRDLLHWDKALDLASRLAPDQIVFISKEYAQQLEFTGEYAKALSFYEKGVIREFDENNVEILEHNEICSSGVAKMSIRTGNIRRGMEMAAEIPGRVVKRDCAQILEQMKQFNDAAHLYEIGMFHDRAAAASLKAKNWAKVGELLPNVRSPKIHAQYGKVMEHEKKYKAAALAYKNAKDYDSLVRVLLDHLNLPEEAVKVVRESRSVEGAKLVAKFFSKIGDHASAIQFLVLSHCHQEAFHLAEAEAKMEVYADCVAEEGSAEQFKQLAEWFSARKQSKVAGKFHLKSRNFRTAMDLLLLGGEDEEALQLAIECAAESRDAQLAERLTEFLMGELDGVPKDPRFLFRFYVAMRMFPSAAKTATIIAREEQSRGNYRVARDLLFTMTQELKQQRIRIPAEMVNNLMLVHSYLIVKSHIKKNDQNTAARLLIRVADNISRFPTHVVPILTSTVITCSKAGLRQSAFNYAVMLLRPENRKKIDERYRKRIEAIVRKQERTGGEVDNKSLCPHCEQPSAEFELTCGVCKNVIPFCVVTGRHIVAADFCLCPSCSFPAIRSEFVKLVDANEGCPMCGKTEKSVPYGDAKAFLYSVAQLNSQPDEPF